MVTSKAYLDNLALKYRARCIKALSMRIAKVEEALSLEAVAMMLMLTTDEVWPQSFWSNVSFSLELTNDPLVLYGKCGDDEVSRGCYAKNCETEGWTPRHRLGGHYITAHRMVCLMSVCSLIPASLNLGNRNDLQCTLLAQEQGRPRRYPAAGDILTSGFPTFS